ncbi:gametocyte associated protein (GAP), partial [Plasmodium gaboni]
MRRTYSRIYCINLSFVIICTTILFIYDTVSNGLVSKKNIVSENKIQNNYEVKSRILSSHGGVQGIWNSRSDLLRFRRRSTYTHLDRLHDCFFRGFLDSLIWLTEEIYKNENSNENNDDVIFNNDVVTSNHDGVTSNHDGIISNHDGVTSNNEDVNTTNEQVNTNVEMIEKIIRKQMYLEGITLSNRTVSNEVRRTKERHDEITSQGTTAEVMERMMKLYEIENKLSKDIIKK